MSTNNPWYFIGAAVVGIVSAAGMFLVEHLRQERRRQMLAQDLERLDRQVSNMRVELEQLRLLQRDKKIRTKQNDRRPVSVLSTTTDDYSSAVEFDEGSDLEFYDLSDEESGNNFSGIERMLHEIDEILDYSGAEESAKVLEQLKNLQRTYPKDIEIPWRIGRTYYKLAEHKNDLEPKKSYINEGIQACTEGLNLNPKHGITHKWLAILIGKRSGLQPLKERIVDGHLFKKHLDEALELLPDDATLHHLLGRFAFEVASLKWYERKAAATFIAAPPEASYEEALGHCLKAQKLRNDWKENLLLIGKCYGALGNYNLAVKWINKADAIKDCDELVNEEVKSLLSKYGSYR